MGKKIQEQVNTLWLAKVAVREEYDDCAALQTLTQKLDGPETWGNSP
jgi:hypothetical protein